LADSAPLRGLFASLELAVPEWLGWVDESLDGILLGGCRRGGENTLEFAGTCILIKDQTETPIALRIRAHPSGGGLVEVLCRVGEPDPESGELLRLGYGGNEARNMRLRTAEQPDRVPWMYIAEVGEDISVVSRTTQRCVECESLYFKDASRMSDLCPECAHRLYGYPRCDHDLERDRCLHCFWDGSVSDYLAHG